MSARYAVIGGGGFVGSALATALSSAGHEVVCISRKAYPKLVESGIKCIQLDIGEGVDVLAGSLKGCEGVFHTAAKVDMWGRYESFFKTNVVGTRHVIEACRRAGVRNLVFTSSPSVVHDGSNLEGIDESYPYPKRYDAFYPMTKAQAEREILAANDIESLRTVSLRPHLIWGPDDTHLVPTIVDRARAGTLRRIGTGKNLVDLTFIDDCVSAHLAAMKTLEQNPERAAGKAYFISQGEPTPMWDWIDDVLKANGLPRVRRSLPTPLAMGLAHIMEAISRCMLLFGVEIKPLLTRFLVSEMSTSHYFSIANARRDLGFKPGYTIAQALARTFYSPQKEAQEHCSLS